MTQQQRVWRALVPWSTSVSVVLMATTVWGQTPQPPQPAPSPTPAPSPAPTPTPTPTATPTPEPESAPAPENSEPVTDSVNVPVQVRASVSGIPIVDTQQLLHKSSADDEPSSSSETAAVRPLNDLNLSAVGLRLDVETTTWARTPGENGSVSGAPTRQSSAARSANGQASGPSSTQTQADALAHAALTGTAEAVVRLGDANTEIVSVSGRGLASTAEVRGACGSLSPVAEVSLGSTNLRVLGREIALPENPEPNTEVPLTDIPGLVDGTLVLNEQTTFGDGANTQVVAVAPLRLRLRLSQNGLGGLADVEVNLAGNSASVTCAPTEEPPTTPTTPPATPPASASPSSAPPQ